MITTERTCLYCGRQLDATRAEGTLYCGQTHKRKAEYQRAKRRRALISKIARLFHAGRYEKAFALFQAGTIAPDDVLVSLEALRQQSEVYPRRSDWTVPKSKVVAYYARRRETTAQQRPRKNCPRPQKVAYHNSPVGRRAALLHYQDIYCEPGTRIAAYQCQCGYLHIGRHDDAMWHASKWMGVAA